MNCNVIIYIIFKCAKKAETWLENVEINVQFSICISEYLYY